MEPLVLLAEIVPAAQSLTLGLVQEVVDDAGLGARVAAIGAHASQWSPTSVAVTKRGGRRWATSCSPGPPLPAATWAPGSSPSVSQQPYPDGARGRRATILAAATIRF